MIYTITCNPSLDYITGTEGFRLGKTNRTTSQLLLPGGKGINVSTVLHSLGIPSTALGFIAGFTGAEIRRMVEGLGFQSEFIDAGEGCSRINVKIKEFDGTEINGQGPRIRPEAVRQLMARLEKLQAGDFVVLAGSLPSGLPGTFYRDIMKALGGRGVSFAVDAERDLLLDALPLHPFLIKPNHHELGDLFHVTLTEKEKVVPWARALQDRGARNVLVSMGGSGAVLLDERGAVHMLSAPQGRLVNAVGAGDSMVAGFLAGWLERKDYSHAFRLAVSAGSASAFSEFLADGAAIRRLYRTISNEQKGREE